MFLFTLLWCYGSEKRYFFLPKNSFYKNIEVKKFRTGKAGILLIFFVLKKKKNTEIYL